jgi:hypothetical protein
MRYRATQSWESCPDVRANEIPYLQCHHRVFSGYGAVESWSSRIKKVGCARVDTHFDGLTLAGLRFSLIKTFLLRRQEAVQLLHEQYHFL